VWVEVEREKAAVGDDYLFFVDDSAGCPALDGTQGAGAGLFDILVLLDGNGDRTAGRISARNAAKLV
jgi:hypothetical protein